MKTRTLAKLVVAGGTALLCGALLEAVVRAGARCDADGNCWFREARLKPYRVPARKSEQIISQYLKSKDSVLQYDPELGWNQRPGVHDHNLEGFISTSGDLPKERPAGRLRIALFGGSYTEGTFEKGWWRVLQKSLDEDGVNAEVLNFGVAGYGMDQAYLRWKRDGAPYHPDVVLFGFAAGNCYDNLNMIRMVKDPETGVPFTKPRFLLQDGKLSLLNSPTPPPAELAPLLRDLRRWPLLAHEQFYRAADFSWTPWRFSRALAFAEAKLTVARERRAMPEFYRPGNEPADLALAIVRQFAEEAIQSGSAFWIVHLPHHRELEDLKTGGKFAFQPMLDSVDRIAPTCHTERAMLDACGKRRAEEFFVEGHYGEALQAVAGHEIARFIEARAAGLQR